MQEDKVGTRNETTWGKQATSREDVVACQVGRHCGLWAEEL